MTTQNAPHGEMWPTATSLIRERDALVADENFPPQAEIRQEREPMLVELIGEMRGTPVPPPVRLKWQRYPYTPACRDAEAYSRYPHEPRLSPTFTPEGTRVRMTVQERYRQMLANADSQKGDPK